MPRGVEHEWQPDDEIVAAAATAKNKRALAGDHEATRRYDQAMRALSAVTIAWRELHTSSA